MISRRRLLAAFGAAALGEAFPSFAQPAKARRIGFLLTVRPPDSERAQAFRQRLRELGYVEGQNLVIEWRFAEGREERLPALAADLVRINVEVIVADVTNSVRAAMKATPTIPIVMTGSADPVGTGLVSGLSRPGGNVTGNSVMFVEMGAKRLQLLKEAAPRVSRVAVLWNPATLFHKATLKEIDAAAPSLGIKPIAIAVRSRNDLGDALSQIRSARAEGVLVNETMTPTARRQLFDFAAEHRLPTMSISSEDVLAGGLMSYAPDFTETYRNAAVYVDKILKGAKPGDLPVVQPTKYELMINMKAARALGVTVPQSVLLRADKVIE